MVRIGLLVCLVAIVAGPLYTEPGYSYIEHSISELAAQNTENAWIMRVGLFSLGAGVVIGYVQSRSKLDLPFLIFGVFIVLSALLPHKPFVVGRTYSDALDMAHSACASLAGLASVVGFLLLAIAAKTIGRRVLYAAFTGAYTVLPLAMFSFPSVQGVLQRIIFLSFIVWAIFDYPRMRDT